MLEAKGLTSSEASHIANFLKEQVKAIDITAESFQVVTSIGTRDGKEHPLDNNKEITDWEVKLLEKARFYALSAWLKEAIKAKDDLIKNERSKSFNVLLLEGLKKYPEAPARPDVSFDTFFRNQLVTREQSDYLSAEALASHVGKFIHSFDEVRKQFQDFKPTRFIKLSETETMTVTDELLYNEAELIKKFEQLQSIHRDAEKVINSFKAKHKNWVATTDNQYQLDVARYKREIMTTDKENNAIIQEHTKEFEIIKTNNISAYSALKIIIPNDLQPIMDEVTAKLKPQE